MAGRENKTTFLSEHTCANPHMQISAGEPGSVLRCTRGARGGGGAQTITLGEQTAAKCTTFLEFRRVSQPLTRPEGRRSTREEVQAPLCAKRCQQMYLTSFFLQQVITFLRIPTQPNIYSAM